MKNHFNVQKSECTHPPSAVIAVGFTLPESEKLGMGKTCWATSSQFPRH